MARIQRAPNSRPTACYAGTRIEALQALERYADVISVITVSGSRVDAHCNSNKIPCHITNWAQKNETFRLMSTLPVDVVWSAGFPYIVPASVLASGPLFVNSHPALLPSRPGFSAIKEAFKAGDEYMGVTIHFMVEQVDAGPPMHQEKVWVKELPLPDVYDLLFGVVEPMAITKAAEILFAPHGTWKRTENAQSTK